MGSFILNHNFSSEVVRGRGAGTGRPGASRAPCLRAGLSRPAPGLSHFLLVVSRFVPGFACPVPGCPALSRRVAAISGRVPRRRGQFIRGLTLPGAVWYRGGTVVPVASGRPRGGTPRPARIKGRLPMSRQEAPKNEAQNEAQSHTSICHLPGWAFGLLQSCYVWYERR